MQETFHVNIYTKPLANSKVNRLLGLMMNLPSVSEWNGFLGCEAPKYENWVDISERTITIASLKKIKKLHTTHSFWNKNFHCHFPLTLQNHCGIAVDFHARSCRHTAKMTRTTLSRDWAGQTSFLLFLLNISWLLSKPPADPVCLEPTTLSTTTLAKNTTETFHPKQLSE